jgi:hypothetical protein
MSKTRFEDASQQLLRVVRERIRGGAASERGLAKLAGVSQPHMHNVLAGKRGLAVGVADRLLAILGMSLEDLLLDAGKPMAELGVPLLESPIGGGRAFPRIASGQPLHYFDRVRLEPLQSPCLGRVADDEIAMRPTLWPGDDVLLDFGWRTRRRPHSAAIYAIEWQGRSYLCRCYTASGALITLVESQSRVAPPERISLEARNVEDIVRAEIVWFGRMLTRS